MMGKWEHTNSARLISLVFPGGKVRNMMEDESNPEDALPGTGHIEKSGASIAGSASIGVFPSRAISSYDHSIRRY